MSDGIHPSGPAQPTLNDAYNTKGNPATTEPAEDAQARSNASSNAPKVAHRDGTHDQTADSATPSSLGLGVRRPNASGEESHGATHESVGRHNELDAEQMAAPGEGKVADVVDRKPGASGAQPGFESDLERKKEEQKGLREEKKEEREDKVDVGGVLGQRGGPANPVDKDGYPNSGN